MKYVKYTLLALLLVVIAAVTVAWFYLETIVKTTVNKYGTQITGTQVQLQSFSLNPIKGLLKVGGLTIANPEGYSAPNLLTLANVSVKVDPKSLFKDNIVIEDISINNPSITYEMPDFTTSNVMQIQQNIAKNTSDTEETATQEETSDNQETTETSSKTVSIKRVLVEGGILNAITPLQKNETALNIDLPSVELVDLGGENQKLTIKDSIVEIFNKILFNATSTVAKALGSAKDIAKKATTSTIDTASNAVEGAKEQGKSLIESLKFW